MGPKIRVISVFMILFVSMVLSFSLFEDAEAQPVEYDLKDVGLYLHNDPANATLNTSMGQYEEHHVLTTEPADIPRTPIELGEWITNPISYPLVIEGQIQYVVYALGNLQQVQFTAALSVNGVDVVTDMTTLPQDLNESYVTEFISNPVNTTLLEINTTQVIGFRLSVEHNDPQWYSPPPLGSGGKNVTLVFGFGMGTFIVFPTNSMKVDKITGEDDPQSSNMIVTAQIKCSFGVEDFKNAYASTEYKYGNRFTELSKTVIDDATVEVEWEWDYSVTEGGSYPVTVKATDGNFNRWEKTEDVHITTPETEIDFYLEGSDISFSKDPAKDKNTTITAKISGSGKRWSTYQVDIEFYDGSDLLDKVKASISKGGTNEVTLLWTPDSTGKHTIKVVIDPDDDFSETNENNNEATKSVDVGEGGSKNTPGFEGVWVIAAFALVLFFVRRFR